MLASQAIDMFNARNNRRVTNNDMSKTTAGNYARDLRDFLTILNQMDGDIAVADITPPMLEDVFEAYAGLPDARCKNQSRARATPRSARTRNRFYYSVSALFTYLTETGELATNPVKHAAGKVRLSTQDLDPKRKSIGQANVERLLQAPMTARDEFIIRVLTTAGVRVGELCACDTDDLTYDKDLNCWWLRLTHTKNGAPRRVALSDVTVSFYHHYLTHDIVPPAERPNGMPIHDAEKALLRTARGLRITPRDIQNLLRRLGPSSGVHTTPHGLRHTAATMWVSEGVDVHVVRDLLGHSSISVTSQYLDSANADLAELAHRASVDKLGRK